MLNKRQKYLQIALNDTLEEAGEIIYQIPLDERIIIEVRAPLIKRYGLEAIKKISYWWQMRTFGYSFESSEKFPEMSLLKFLLKTSGSKTQNTKNEISKKERSFTPYIVADLKCMDRGATEVALAKKGGVSAAVVLRQAPIETIDAFIKECEKQKIDAMIDMMNVEYPLAILRNLKKTSRSSDFTSGGR